MHPVLLVTISSSLRLIHPASIVHLERFFGGFIVVMNIGDYESESWRVSIHGFDLWCNDSDIDSNQVCELF